MEETKKPVKQTNVKRETQRDLSVKDAGGVKGGMGKTDRTGRLR